MFAPPFDLATAMDALWAKLIVNCAYNALSALTRMPYGRMLRQPGVEEVMADVVAECVAVARAAGGGPAQST